MEYEQEAIGEEASSSDSETGVNERGGVDKGLKKNFNDNSHEFNHKLL